MKRKNRTTAIALKQYACIPQQMLRHMHSDCSKMPSTSALFSDRENMSLADSISDSRP